MRNKLFCITGGAVLLCTLCIHTAFASDGTINFSGNVVNAPCSLSTESANQVVDLGQQNLYNPSGEPGGAGSTNTQWFIKLTNCEPTTSAQIAFSGDLSNAGGDQMDELATTTPDLLIRSRLNVDGGVEIVKIDGTPINLPEISEGDNTLSFYSFLASYNWPGVAESTYTASMSFTMIYN